MLLVLRVFAAIFMVGSLASAGLTVAPRDVLVPLKHGRFVVTTLVIGWVVGPLLAILLLRLIPLEAPYATGLLLLALAPCAPPAAARARIAAWLWRRCVSARPFRRLAIWTVLYGCSRKR